MHIPDGFINGGTSAAAGVVAVAGLSVCVVKAAKTMDDKQVPMAGLAAAFIFAVQMLNFPVASGTSGHLLGGVLAAVLVGPWAGRVVCVGGARRAGSAVRRRRAVGPRPQHHQHGARRRVGWLRCSSCVVRKVAARAPERRSSVAAGIAAGSGAGAGGDRVHLGVRHRRQRRRLGGDRRRGDGRRARADRHRRGHHHRPRRRCGHGGAARPRLRRP